jgi:hypothetical protein
MTDNKAIGNANKKMNAANSDIMQDLKIVNPNTKNINTKTTKDTNCSLSDTGIRILTLSSLSIIIKLLFIRLPHMCSKHFFCLNLCMSVFIYL